MADAAEFSFDYVIVGAGSAGCVLANRLTQDPEVTVLLIEAGGSATGLWNTMPIAFTQYDRLPRLNWNFVSEPEPYADGRRIDAPRGKVVGGSSVINGMVYARGHRLDYDDWAQKGLRGWGYADVLPYFKQSEKSWLGEGKYHGGSGELEVAVPDSNQMFDELKAATVAAGFPSTDDYHGDQNEGAQRCEVTVAKGRRAATSRVFLDPVRRRPNLTVASKAHTTRVLFEGKRAVGVEFIQDGRTKTVGANREVLLSGGAFGSPQILMLSGIGPAEHLRSHGIEPLVDLPGVGKNLVEHPFLFVGWKAQEDKIRSELRFDRAVVSVARWFLFGSGPFANNGAAGNIFIRTHKDADRPDMQFTCMASGVTGRKIWYPLIGKRPSYMIGVGVSMIKQDSRGEVTLNSADPFDPPKILFNLFKEKSDVDRMVRGIRIIRKIYNSEPLKSLIDGELSPGEQVQSDAELEAFVRSTGAITLHPVGTCKMGLSSDPMAVVDAELKVHGVEGLRVVDASIMPDVPGGNTNAPTIMVAEKAADMIRGRSLPRAEV